MVGMYQDSINILLIRHPKVSTLLALQVTSTVVFEQTALPEVTSTGLVRLSDRLGVPAYIINNGDLIK
jgi:nitrous oxidase accessory protein NosD